MSMTTAGMTVSQPNLPPEIWSQILQYIPRFELEYVLGVCSQFHDIVVRRLFSSIKIFFIGGKAGMKMLNTFHLEWTLETTLKLMCKSWEILNRISQDPQFAKVVKHITVIAYAEGLGIFERLTVANIFQHVPNLQTFRWVGCNPAFDHEIAERLPSTLRSLDVQSTLPLESLEHLTRITALHLPNPFLFPDDDEAIDRLVEDESLVNNYLDISIERIIEVFPSCLQSLRICASHINHIPIRLYSALRDLEIFGTIGDEQEFIGLDVMFRHAILLESLSVVGYIHTAFFSFLPHWSTASLPLLNSFRISVESAEYMGEDQFCALTGFLHGRSLLRKLYLRHPEIRFGQISRLLRVIQDFTGLEALGIHTGVDAFVDATALGMIANALSQNLRALHIAINWGGDDFLPLMDRIGSLPKLKFLHLYGVLTRLPISVDEVAVEAKGLDTIGLNRSLWNIQRVGPEIFTTKWPRWRVKFCVEEEFVSSDDYWLFKYN